MVGVRVLCGHRPSHALGQVVHQRTEKPRRRTRRSVGYATGGSARSSSTATRSGSPEPARAVGRTRPAAERHNVGCAGSLIDRWVAAVLLTPTLESVVQQAPDRGGVALAEEFAF